MPINIRMTAPRMRWSMPYEPRVLPLWLQVHMVLRDAVMRGILAPKRICATFAPTFAQVFVKAFVKALAGSNTPPVFPVRSAKADPVAICDGVLCISPPLAKNSILIAPEQEKHCA